MRRVLLGFATFGLLSGCAHQQAAENHVGVSAGANTGIQANLTEAGLFGPDVSISRLPSAYRGQALGQPIDLSWTPEQVVGMVGDSPTRLNWVPEGDGVRIHGLYAGQITDIQVGEGAINGAIGACTYDLQRGEGEYRGFQQCGGIMERNTRLVLPSGLQGREPGERVAVLALVLGEYRAVSGGIASSGDFRPAPTPAFWKGMYPGYRR